MAPADHHRVLHAVAEVLVHRREHVRVAGHVDDHAVEQRDAVLGIVDLVVGDDGVVDPERADEVGVAG